MGEVRTIAVMGVGSRKEAEAASAIDPGDLVVFNSSGLLERNGTAAVKVAPMFAVENELFGKAIYSNGSIVSYAAADRVSTETFTSGQEVNVCVAAGAPAIVIGDFMDAAADGTLRKAAAGTAAGVIAQAREAVDNSGGATKTHIRVVIV